MTKEENLENKFNEVIFKDKTIVTCDNENCEYRGNMLWCYLCQEKNCGIYRTWLKNR